MLYKNCLRKIVDCVSPIFSSICDTVTLLYSALSVTLLYCQVVESGVSQHTHQAVSLQFFETMVRYEKFFQLEPGCITEVLVCNYCYTCQFIGIRECLMSLGQLQCLPDSRENYIITIAIYQHKILPLGETQISQRRTWLRRIIVTRRTLL